MQIRSLLLTLAALAAIGIGVAAVGNRLGWWTLALPGNDDVKPIEEPSGGIHVDVAIPDSLEGKEELARRLSFRNEHAQSELVYRQILEIQERDLGADHLDTCHTRLALGNALDAQKKFTEAEYQYRLLYQTRLKKNGPTDRDTLTSRIGIPRVLRSQGKHAEAEKEFRATHRLVEGSLGPAHWVTLTALYQLAETIAQDGRRIEALALARHAEDLATTDPNIDPRTAMKIEQLVEKLTAR